MPDAPRSLIAFQRQFPDEATCAVRLAAIIRWSGGFRCPACGHEHAWHLKPGCPGGSTGTSHAAPLHVSQGATRSRARPSC